MFHDMFMHCIYEYSMTFEYIASQIDGYEIHPIFQLIESVLHQKFNDNWKRVASKI
jgi:hypothetical protein